MKKLLALSAITLAGLGVLAVRGTHTAKAQSTGRDILPLQLEEEIPVPGVAGRLDHFTADVKRKRLFVSALGNNTVEVIDTFAGRVIRSIKGLSQPQGPLYVPGFDKLYVANAENGKMNVYDGATYTLKKTIDFGTDPDNVRYDAASKKIFVGFGEEDGGIAMVDPATDERVGQVYKTEGHPESFQVEASGGHIYANVPDAGMVVESIDRKTGAVTKWPLKGLKGNYAMALNEEDHRLFTVTRKTPMLVVLDTQTGNEIARLRAAGECDDVYFDAARKRIYVLGGEGIISVIQQKDPDHYELVANVPSGIGIRTGFFYSKRDRLYVGVPAKGNEPAQVWTFEAED
ncbi:MAG TPA: YncE family protein [Candidatus Acidoferrum sp.]|nr:YncE family protein [Candidatus Acidoferrum sp.]